MGKKLHLSELLSGAFSIGIKNAPSVVACLFLWLVTFWIPYVNVGTTIAIATLPAALSRNAVINPLDIFNKRYYKFMGEFFLVSGLKMMILLPALIFLFFPAVVMSIAYSLSTLLVVDKGKGATEALKISNQLTYGNKWTIFLSRIVLTLIVLVGAAVFLFLLSLIFRGGYLNPQYMMYSGFRGMSLIPMILSVLIYFLIITIFLGFNASVYGQLSSDINEE